MQGFFLKKNCVSYRCKKVSFVMELGVSLICFWKPIAAALFFRPSDPIYISHIPLRLVRRVLKTVEKSDY
jgi:hypothetical protein